MESPVHPSPLAHLPLLALRIPGQVKQCQRVKKLPELGGWGGSLFSKCGVRWDSDPEVDTQGVDGDTQV